MARYVDPQITYTALRASQTWVGLACPRVVGGPLPGSRGTGRRRSFIPTHGIGRTAAARSPSCRVRRTAAIVAVGMGDEFETVIGLECHAEVATATKMYVACAN